MISKQLGQFTIKFCGFRRVEDINAAIAAGVDAIGLNFCPSSPRFVTMKQAADLAKANDGRVCLVGVFVNPSLEMLREAIEVCQLDLVQLHGDENPDLVSGKNLRPLIKALPWREANQQDMTMADVWAQSVKATNLNGFLVDAFDPSQRGGTGKVTRWDLLNPRPTLFNQLRLILAGGLTSINVAQAIEMSCPDAVDTASGIESSPGIKDEEKMRSFVIQAKKGFERAKQFRT